MLIKKGLLDQLQERINQTYIVVIFQRIIISMQRLIVTGKSLLTRKIWIKKNNAGKQNVATHELGHGLRLGHNASSDVMYQYSTSKTTLSTNDKQSYDAAYKKILKGVLKLKKNNYGNHRFNN